MLARVSRRALAEWGSLFSAVPRPSRLQYLGLPGSLEGGTCSFLAFAEGTPRPAFVVKVHRFAAAAAEAGCELGLLELLRATPCLEESTPRGLFAEEGTAGAAVVQSFVEGTPMQAAMGADGIPDLAQASGNFSLAADWLARLHEGTFLRSEEARVELCRRATATVSGYMQSLRPSSRAAALLASAEARITRSLAGGAVQHGDFCRHNILLDEESRARVIDWTDARRLGLPLHDLFFFLSTYYLQLRPTEGLGGFLDAFRKTFLDTGPYSKLARDTVLFYCSRAGVPPTLAADSLVLFLAERALFEAGQVERCRRRGELPRFRDELAFTQHADPAEARAVQVWSHFLEELAKAAQDPFAAAALVHQTETVSVIVPCFNEASTVARCIESVTGNGFDPARLEVVVVDGGSTDGTVEILRELQARHPSVRILENPKRIIPSALNIGIRECRGSVVMRLDAHAAMDHGYIEECLSLLRRNPGAMVGGRMRTLPRKQTPISRAIAAALSARFGVGDSEFRLPVDRRGPDAQSADTIAFWACRREVLEFAGPFDERLARSEDIEFSTRLGRLGVRKLLSSRTACTYYARSSLRELWRHSVLNGVWAVLPFRYAAGMPVRPRHLVPLAFVLALAASASAGWRPLAALSGVYGAACVAASALAAMRQRDPSLLVMMPLTLATLHLGYGVGSLGGVAALICGRTDGQRC